VPYALGVDREPFELVEVDFSNADYLNVCDTFGGGFALLDQWKELARIFFGRAGWHFEVVNSGEAIWSLGDLGGSHLNVSVTPEGFNCYNHATDDSPVLASIDAVERWLAPIEDGARRFPIEVAKASGWGVLRSHPFVIRVDVTDGKFCADIKGLSEERWFADTIAQVVSDARERIMRYFDAPDEIEPDLKTELRLSPAASNRLL